MIKLTTNRELRHIICVPQLTCYYTGITPSSIDVIRVRL